MGALTIQIGGLSRSLNPTDQKMTNVMVEVVEATKGPVNGTNTQKIDHILMVIRRHLVEVANANRQMKEVSTAEATAEAQKLDLNEG